MNHYETLGVPRDATSAQIKRAFRKAAMRAHPDREGGSAERMARVNAAWEQLGDEQRRKIYDETGEDAPLNQETSPAEMMVMQALQSVIDSCGGDILGAARAQLERGLAGAHQQIAACEAAIKKAKALRGKVKGPAGRNLVYMILDTRVEQATAQRAAGEEVLARVKEALRVLTDYSRDADGNVNYDPRFVSGFDFARMAPPRPSSGPFKATRPEDGL